LRTFGARLKKGFANCGDELWRNVSSHYFAHKLIPGLVAFRVNRFNIANDTGVLPSSS